MCREYFSQDAQIPALAMQIYTNVNFNWMLNGGSALSMGWTPENGFLAVRWDHYSELMILYLLAMAVPIRRLRFHLPVGRRGHGQ